MSFSETREEAEKPPGAEGKSFADDDASEEDASGSSQLTGSSNLTRSSEEEGEEVNWITWFCSLKGNDFFCEIEEEYIQDDFNLTGLSSMIPYYDYALDMMLDVEIPTERLTSDQLEIVETATEVLYGLIHARYILTVRGMSRMKEKLTNVDFGRCPRVFCEGQSALPVGISDTPRNYSVAAFCPRCRDIFYPRSARQANLDGAYFGTTFAHLFLMCYPEMIPAKPHQSYEPRVFGFRVHKDSHYWQQPAASSPTAEEAWRDVHNNTSNNNYSSPSAKTKGSKVGAPDALPPAPGSAQSTIKTGALSALPKPPA